MIVCDCPHTQLCGTCLRRAIDWLSSTALHRGERWAQVVAEHRPALLAQPWPPLEGKCAAIAARWVADLSVDPRVLDHMLHELDRAARARWEKLQRARPRW